MRHLFLSSIIAAVFLGAGVYHGLATDRWSAGVNDDANGGFLADVPMTIGDWIGERLPRDADDDPKTFVLDCRFTNRKTGKWVLTAISSGRAGRVAIHNP